MTLQNFQDISNKSNMDTKHRVAKIRAVMQEQGLDAYVVPHSDENQNEYLPSCCERLSWCTGFSGSAGLAIIMHDVAALFVDGRYTIQANIEVDTSIFRIHETSDVAWKDWLASNVTCHMCVGLCSFLFTVRDVKRVKEILTRKNASLILNDKKSIVDDLWDNRPPPPMRTIFVHDERFCGMPYTEKLEIIAQILVSKGLDSFIITNLDSIAWLTNLRGSDLPHTPLFLSFAVINKSGFLDIFIYKNQTSSMLADYLKPRVRIHFIENFLPFIGEMSNKKIGIDDATCPYIIMHMLQNSCLDNSNNSNSSNNNNVQFFQDPCIRKKAVKNKKELEGAYEAHLLDGVAMCRFLAWLDKVASDVFSSQPSMCVPTEIDIAIKLENFRACSADFRDISFDTISALGFHGAMAHYKPTEKTALSLRNNDLLLLDSGGQYAQGTTDVTRTVCIGRATCEQKEMFTLVLKGHIALASACFPQGTSGDQLDVLARMFLWGRGCDYAHGTGHGVGSYLSVHEGPQSFSKKGSFEPLAPGMLISNEPGLYKEGGYGIRIENIVLVKEIGENTTFSQHNELKKFLSFETLTLAPLDKRLMDLSLLTSDEKQWINCYHQNVYKKISSLLNSKYEQEWLYNATVAL